MDELYEELGRDDDQSQEAFGMPPCVPAPPSEPGASTAPRHWLERSTLEEYFSLAMDKVPGPLQALTLDAAARWEMRQEPILATLLHILAAAAGLKHRLRRAHLGLSCPFSLVVCGEGRSRQNWTEFLAEPWLGQLRARLRTHQAFGAKHFIEEIKSLEQQSELTFGSIADKQRLLMNAYLTLAPCAMERSPLPGSLLEALKNSLGRTVVSLNGGVDPMEELHRASRKSLTELCRLLEMSWRDMDLPGKGAIPRRGVIHLLWRTEAISARKVVCGAQSPWRTQIPPVLLFREGPPPPYLARLHADTFGGWAILLKSFIDSVEATNDATVWTLSPEADSLAAEFCRDLAAPSSALAPINTTHLEWFHELVIRLAMLLTVLDTVIKRIPSGETIISVEAMDRACFLGWWMAREHHACFKWLATSRPVDSEECFKDLDGIDSIDTEQVRAAILDRLGAKGPLSRRDLTRTFHEMSARARDSVLAGLKREGLVAETADGKVALAESSGLQA